MYINDEKYFDNVQPEVWNYEIGGYQELYKFLKDRKGRNIYEAVNYCKIITALSLNIITQQEIGKTYPEVEKRIIEF
ncbi:MAG: hypothetical protein KBF06_02315 [Bacteroidales bacterium]|nr:hypothetical protein [Bacteroidales bacterium]MBP9511305.1 hypothetical protein [Bacteroidales bacterium]MBP9588160.1 hypothetical protein [Bacteroidales bacterium]NMD16485.1 hypothetical protein [Bacteroidales bacterium]